MIKDIQNSRYQLLIKWLKQERLDQNLTVRDMGQRLDEPHQLVSKIETAQRNLTVYEYVQYCDALNVDPHKGIELISAGKVTNPLDRDTKSAK